MAYSLAGKLVVAVASSALFDLSESDNVYRKQDVAAYRKFQLEHEDVHLDRGPAFPLVERLLSLNEMSTAEGGEPIEVVLLSRNDLDTGLRVFNSIEHYELGISRAAFVSGRDPWRYLESFNVSLFLSGNADDVKNAIKSKIPAGLVNNNADSFSDDGDELRIAFDFDGVLADDSSEKFFRSQSLEEYLRAEKNNADVPLGVGPLFRFFVDIVNLQERQKNDKSDGTKIRTAIITARSAPAHERVIKFLRWAGVRVDEAFFLGGVEKFKVLKEFKPHMFFDDQRTHIEGAESFVPSALVPFGIANAESDEHIENGKK